MFRKLLLSALFVALPLVASAQIVVPNTLQAGQVIRAAELNTNFSAVADKALNRITGGLIEGNITVATGVTIDGVDISAFLRPTGEIRAQTAGSDASPSFSRSGDTSTGIHFPANGELAFSLSGTTRLTLTSSGLTVFGVNIVNAEGKIPALTSTYVASLDGSGLTNLNASNVSSGTLPDGRLSSNIARTNTGQTFSGTQIFTAIGTSAIETNTFRLGATATSGYVLTTDANGNGTWQSPGVATGAVPSGLIAMFDTSCPATWTRVAAWDNKFVRGGATYSVTGGGSDTHTHSVDPAPVTSGGGGDHNHNGSTLPAGGHSHSVDIASTATSSSGTHSHGGSFSVASAGSHSHTGTTDNGGDHSHTTSNSFIASGGVESVVTGINSGGSHNHTFSTSSSGDHTHSITGGTDSGGAHTHTVDPVATATTAVSDHSHLINTEGNHTHSVDVASTTTSSGANVPAYVQVVFCKKD